MRHGRRQWGQVSKKRRRRRKDAIARGMQQRWGGAYDVRGVVDVGEGGGVVHNWSRGSIRGTISRRAGNCHNAENKRARERAREREAGWATTDWQWCALPRCRCRR